MKTFYWYCGAVVAVFVLALIAVSVYSFSRPSSEPGNAGLVTLMALAGPFVCVWFIALGWVTTILWKKFGLHDPSISRTTLIIAFVLLLVVLKSPFDAYRNFFPKADAAKIEVPTVPVESMIKLNQPVRLEVATPVTIIGKPLQKFDVKEGETTKIQFTYPAVGVTPPVTGTLTEVSYLKDMKTEDAILIHAGRGGNKFVENQFDHMTKIETASGTLYVFDREMVPQGITNVYLLSKNGEHGTVVLNPITNLKFDWKTLRVLW